SDIDQSDIGPPCTIAYGYAAKKVTELYEVKMANACFVGVTSPIQAINRTMDGLTAMHREIMHKAEADYVIINVDGWVEGESAVNHKMQLVNHLKPDLIIGIQHQEELKPLLSTINTVSTFYVEASVAVNERVSEKRVRLRELNFAKYLKEAKVRSLCSSYMEIREKNILPKEQGKEKGILVGLLDSKNRFLGIGIMLEYNRVRRVMKVLTPVCVKPAVIAIGRIRLDPELKETPLQN
ncbi:MAG: hypothetical protein FWC33_00750, partial [Candidatus Bathyarchaeota archaeon]|nr:hypothetical protein [Candidatus Termiticorpusculum sp.]